MTLQACIFDLDGVICDTAKYHYAAWKELADSLRIPFTLQDNEQLKGVSRADSLEILLSLGGLTVSAQEKEQMACAKNKRYQEYIRTMTQDELLPGVQTFLQELRTRNIKIALGTASKNAPLILKRLKLGRLFDAVVDGTQVQNPKPAPDVFLKAAHCLQVPPQCCAVFEDAAAGVKAAVAAGMYCVGVGSPENLQEAHICIPGFMQWNADALFCAAHNALFQQR